MFFVVLLQSFGGPIPKQRADGTPVELIHSSELIRQFFALFLAVFAE